MQVAQAASPGCTAQVLGQHPRLGVLVMSYLRAGALRAVEAGAARRPRRGRDGARGRRGPGADPLVLRRPPGARRGLPDRRDLLRHPARALPARHRGAPWRPGAADRGAGEDDAEPSRRPGAWRRQPEEHPGRRAGPGADRCRVRLVGRSGVRHRLLPQPPAVEVPVESAGDRRLPRELRGAVAQPTSMASTGSPRQRSSSARRRCCRASSSPASTASRRSSTSPKRPTRRGCAGSAGR